MVIVFLIVVIWLAIFGALIKLDIGGFGSGVLSPILKDVPLVNKILPEESQVKVAEDKNNEFKSLSQAIAKIKELQQTVDDMNQSNTASQETIVELNSEIKRLKVFEKNQKQFEKEKKEFDENVVFADSAPDISEYKKYYEEIDKSNAAEIYRQVVEQLQYSNAIKEKADIYKNMDPAAAAKILETMTGDVESVAKILLIMKPKESGAIMAEMDNVVAAKITKKMIDLDAEKLTK
jgi:flagellar motility protein MotE (MotC chaperone)